MTRITQKILLPVAVILAVIAGCRTVSDLPDTPYLEWRGHEVKEDPQSGRNSIELTVFFQDGDGDIGYTQQELNAMDSCNIEYNLLINYFEKTGGSFKKIEPTDTCLPFHNLVPDIRQEGQNPTLEGIISTNFSYLGLPHNANVDSVKFELQLIDRSRNKSNIITSPAISVSGL